MNSPASPVAPAFSIDHVTSLLERQMPECTRFLKEIVGINSFTGNRAGVNANAAQITAQFAEFGFVARSYPCGVLGSGDHLVLDSGSADDNRPTIVLISHLDTVYPEEEERRNAFYWKEGAEGRVTGPGTLDIKGGTAMIWLLMKGIDEAYPETFAQVRWLLLWNAAEECLTPQFGELCLELIPPTTKGCLVFEGDSGTMGDYQLVRARKGRASFRVQVQGRGAHAGGGHARGANAVRQLARVIERAEALTDHCRELTVNVGSVSGGTVVNRVPHSAEATIEMRCYDETVLGEARDALLAMAGEGDVRAESDGFACIIEVEKLEEIAPWSPHQPGQPLPIGGGTEHLVAAWKEAALACGQVIEAVPRGGLSDGNWIASRFATIDGLGPCGGNAHASESSSDGAKVAEFVELSSFVPKTAINLAAVLRLVAG